MCEIIRLLHNQKFDSHDLDVCIILTVSQGSLLHVYGRRCTNKQYKFRAIRTMQGDGGGGQLWGGAPLQSSRSDIITTLVKCMNTLWFVAT